MLSWQIILSLYFVLVLLFSGLLSGKAAAEKPYYQDKVITFVLGSAPGGGTDMFSRLLGRHLTKFIPGRPKGVVRNIPGGGGVIGGNFAYKAKPNGLTVLVSSGGVVMTGLTRPKGTVFKLWKMHPLYSYPTGTVYFSRPKFITKPKDIMTAKGLIWGHNSPTGGVASGFVWSKALIGYNVDKIIWGYGGSGPANLAFFTGETTFAGQSTEAFNVSIIPLIERGEVVALFQSGALDRGGNVVREKIAPDVPTVPELYEQIYNKKPSGPVFEAYKVFVGTRTYGKCLLLPPKVPAKVVDILEKAVAKMVKDPKFLKDAKRLTHGAPHIYGDALVRNYAKGVSGSPEVRKYIKDYLSKEYNLVFD
jgi:hypothetical protein